MVPRHARCQPNVNLRNSRIRHACFVPQKQYKGAVEQVQQNYSRGRPKIDAKELVILVAAPGILASLDGNGKEGLLLVSVSSLPSIVIPDGSSSCLHEFKEGKVATGKT